MIGKLLFSGILLFSATTVGAEEVNDTSKVIDLDEVVVVSQPKDGRLLRHQPLSSTVLTQREMQMLGVSDLAQLSQYVPSFSMPQYGSRLTSSMYIRGIGSRINNPAVGIYYDNIPLMSKAAFNHHFYHIDRVDVLRGPQSTLYGMNTEGGLVHIYSKNPMVYQGTDIHMGIGIGLTSHAEIAHFHRPTEQFAFSAAAFWNGQRGFFKNQALDEWNDKLQEAGGKMRFVYQPTRRLTLDLTADYQWTRQNAFPYGVYDEEANSVQDPSTTLMNGYKRQMVNTGLTVSYKADSWLLSSTTSWQYLRDHMEMDQDYQPADFMHLTQIQKQQALTQELIMRSHGQRKWHWTFGVFGSYQWLRTDAPVTFGPGINNMTAARILKMMPDYVVAMFKVFEIPEFNVTETFHTPSASVGAFHESTLSLTDRLDVTIGLRYEYSKVKIDYNTAGLVALHYSIPPIDQTNRLTAVIANGSDRSFHQLLPKVGATYRLDDSGSNIYATVSKGYRAGGYNIQMFSEIYQSEFMKKGKTLSTGDVTISYTDDDYRAVDETISYDPEESWNYEAGAHLNMLDGKLHADISLYYMQIKNQQLSMMSPDNNFGRIMVNAGKSHTMGFELSLRGRAFDDRLDWFCNVGAVKAQFDEYDTYNDNTIPFVPSMTFSLGGNYRIDRFLVGADVKGQGYTEWNEANTFGQKAYVLLGAHVGYDFGSCQVKLWGRNLTDAKYNTFAVESKATGEALRFAQRGNPLQLGIDLNIHL
jgi:outer membrane receptor protein involved in Fe transport